MDVLRTPLGMDIMDIVDNGDGKIPFSIEAVVHCGEENVSALKVNNLDDYEDFVKNYCNEQSVMLVIPSGKYANKVIPNKDNLEISITIRKLVPITSTTDEEEESAIATERYRALLKKPADTNVGAKSKVTLDEFSMDLSDLDTVEFQLIGKAMEQFGLRYCGGIFRKTKVEDLIKSLLIGESSTLDLESDYKPKGADVTPAYDVKPRETYVIPHGTAVKDAPAYIQKELGGVYAAGLSYYYFEDYWYVYPTFDYTKFSEATKQLVIYRVPEGRLPQVEKTFKTSGNVVSIIVTGGANFVDKSETDRVREGNGIRYTNAGTLFNNTIEVKNNKATYRREKQATEYISMERKAGYNNVTSDATRITTNNLYEASNLAKRNGAHLSVLWENSDPTLIIPGMQVKFMNYEADEVVERFGVVIAKETDRKWTGMGITSGTYVISTVLHIFMKSDSLEEQQ